MIENIQISELIKKINDDDIQSTNLQTKIKLKQISEIYCELSRIKEGLTKYTCQVRNLLHAFGGEMEIFCICVNSEIQSLISLLEDGLTSQNWEKANEIMIILYERIFKSCDNPL